MPNRSRIALSSSIDAAEERLSGSINNNFGLPLAEPIIMQRCSSFQPYEYMRSIHLPLCVLIKARKKLKLLRVRCKRDACKTPCVYAHTINVVVKFHSLEFWALRCMWHTRLCLKWTTGLEKPIICVPLKNCS